MIALAYRVPTLAWRYRRLVALVLTILVGLWERHREKLPPALQKYDPPKRFSKPQ